MMTSDFETLHTLCTGKSRRAVAIGCLVAWLCTAAIAHADLIELLSGAKLDGTVTKIDKEAREVTVSTTMAGRTKLPPCRSPPGSSPNSSTLAPEAFASLISSSTNFFWAGECSGPMVVSLSRP